MLSETGPATTRWYVADQGVIIPNVSKTLQSSWPHFSIFALKKQSENLNFNSFLTFKKTLEATLNETSFGGYFNETRRSTSRKYVAE